MKNVHQKDNSTKQLMSKHKQANQEWEIYAKGTNRKEKFTSKHKQDTQE